MNRKRQNNQQVLALEPKDRGEAPARGDGRPNHSWRNQQPKTRLSQNN